jgi:hypothetical protein
MGIIVLETIRGSSPSCVFRSHSNLDDRYTKIRADTLLYSKYKPTVIERKGGFKNAFKVKVHTTKEPQIAAQY